MNSDSVLGTPIWCVAIATLLLSALAACLEPREPDPTPPGEVLVVPQSEMWFAMTRTRGAVTVGSPNGDTLVGFVEGEKVWFSFQITGDGAKKTSPHVTVPDRFAALGPAIRGAVAGMNQSLVNGFDLVVLEASGTRPLEDWAWRRIQLEKVTTELSDPGEPRIPCCDRGGNFVEVYRTTNVSAKLFRDEGGGAYGNYRQGDAWDTFFNLIAPIWRDVS